MPAVTRPASVVKDISICLLPGQANLLMDFKSRILAALSGTGGGKAIDIETPIPTVLGWKGMGDISIGDEVFDLKGKPTSVTYISPVLIGSSCYNVRFDDGTSLITDAEHLWRVQTFSGRKNLSRQKFSVVTTEHILNHLVGNQGRLEYSIPLAEAIEYNKQNLPIPPYTLGVWLGDGTSRTAGITSADPEIVEFIKLEGVPVSPGKTSVNQGKALTYRIGGTGSTRDTKGRWASNNSLNSRLKSSNLWRNKHIPIKYLISSIDQRLSILQGLMDTDGYCAEDGGCEFTTTNKILAYEVRELISSLGIKTTLREKTAYLHGKNCGIVYVILFTTEIEVFKLPRKLQRQKKKCRTIVKNRYIISIDSIPSRPVKCIKVESLWETYLAGKDYIPTHNTVTGYWWLHSRLEGYPGNTWLVAEPTYGMLEKIILNSSDPARPSLIDYFRNVGHHPDYLAKSRILKTDFGQIYLASADNPDSMQGAAVKGVWLDEAGQMALLAHETAVQRCAMMGGQVLLTTTPYNLGWLKTEIAEAKDPEIHVERWSSIDRPGFPRDSYEFARRTLPPWRFAMMYDALFERPAGLVYDCFDDKIDLVNRMPIPKEWIIYVGHDFGIANPAALFYAQEPASGELYLYAEYRPEEKHSVFENVKEFQKITSGLNVVKRVGGSHQEGETRQAYTQHGWPILEPKDNSVKSQILKVYGMHKLHKIHVFRDLIKYLDEKHTFSFKLNDRFEPTEEIDNEPRYHLMRCESYILSDFMPETVVSFMGRSRNYLPAGSW